MFLSLSLNWVDFLWRSSCSPGGLSSSAAVSMAVVHYLKEGEEQKGVLEAKDDEEEESELDGEVEERVTQHAHETWR